MKPGLVAVLMGVAVAVIGRAEEQGTPEEGIQVLERLQASASPADPPAEAAVRPTPGVGPEALPDGLPEEPPELSGDAPGTADAGRAASPHSGEEAARPPSAIRCRIKLDVSGELIVPAGGDVPPLRRQLGLDARFDFEERPLPGTPVAGTTRRYRDAVAFVTIGDETAVSTLAADARTIRVVQRGAAALPHLEDAFLTDDEHELLDIPFDPLLLDDLLPGHPVNVGASWDISADLTAGLLAIDTVESGTVRARVEELVDGRARVVLSGTVAGGVDGVPTLVELSGSMATAARETEAAADGSRHDLLAPVSTLSVVMRERRQAGHVAAGFEVEARLRMARTAMATEAAEPPAVGADGLHPRVRRGGDGTTGHVWYRDADGRFDLVRDARWRMVEKGPTGVVMRLVDRGALVGQCSITTAAGADGDSAAPTLADLQQDIERSLAGEGARVDEAAAEDRGDGVRVVRVASSGKAAGLQFHWIHYVLAAEEGGRVDVAFMVQDSMRKRFGDADRELVARLAMPGGGRRADSPAAAATSAPDREARKTGEDSAAPRGRL